MRKNRKLQIAATKAANFLRKQFKIRKPIRLGIVLGTGWGDKLKIKNPKYLRFENVPGFLKLENLEGHNRMFIYGTVQGKRVIVLQGRIHLNEDPANSDMVRLQIEILMKLGVRILITTCAAGALPDTALRPGYLVVIDGFVTLFAPRMPLRTGEFTSPEDALTQNLRRVALVNRDFYDGRIVTGGYAMVLGPYFEGRKYDKDVLARTGAKVVGMSTLPEACIAALYGAEVLSLAFVTNDAVEVHSHKENIKKAKQFSASLSNYLTRVIKVI